MAIRREDYSGIESGANAISPGAGTDVMEQLFPYISANSALQEALSSWNMKSMRDKYGRAKSMRDKQQEYQDELSEAGVLDWLSLLGGGGKIASSLGAFGGGKKSGGKT
ncbi:MAG: hypothetical protein WC433_01910 [Candidatus Omnitrophota bacterium]|jgi:hypothetical protein